METRNKLWLGLGVIVAAGAAVYVGTDQPAGMDHSTMASAGATETGEGGEGGEGAIAVNAATDDAAYLTQLGLIRGHLHVGVELYREGDVEASATHMKHPESELYADLLPALEARSAEGFATELSALAAAVEDGSPVDEVNAAYDQLLAGIERAEGAVSDPAADVVGRMIFSLVSVAAAEYDIAVGDGGVLENAHEYQDALGFVKVARDKVEGLAQRGANEQSVAAIREQLDLIAPAWPSLNPPDQLGTEPSLIYGAAGRIEIATLSL